MTCWSGRLLFPFTLTPRGECGGEPRRSVFREDTLNPQLSGSRPKDGPWSSAFFGDCLSWRKLPCPGHSGSSSSKDWPTWGTSEFPAPRSNAGQLWRATPVPERCQGAIRSLCWDWLAPPLALSLPQVLSPKAFLDINLHLRVCFVGNPSCVTPHPALVWRGPMRQLASSRTHGASLPHCGRTFQLYVNLELHDS